MEIYTNRLNRCRKTMENRGFIRRIAKASILIKRSDRARDKKRESEKMKLSMYIRSHY